MSLSTPVMLTKERYGLYTWRSRHRDLTEPDGHLERFQGQIGGRCARAPTRHDRDRPI
jgi:hypothetical protein